MPQETLDDIEFLDDFRCYYRRGGESFWELDPAARRLCLDLDCNGVPLFGVEGVGSVWRKAEECSVDALLLCWDGEDIGSAEESLSGCEVSCFDEGADSAAGDRCSFKDHFGDVVDGEIMLLGVEL